MSVVVKDSLDQGFEFTCGEWALLDPTDKADWTVVSNTCGQPDQEGNPFASSRRFRSVVGDVKVLDPLTTTVLDGVSTIYFKDQPAFTIFSGPDAAGPDDYPTFKLLTADYIPNLPPTKITGFDEAVQDAIGAILFDTSDIDFTYNDATPSISAVLTTTGVTPGTYTHTTLTVDSKGRITAASSGTVTTGTVTSVAATAPTAGFTISGSPITSAGTFVFTLADDLAALEAMSGTGIVVRTAANTYAQRTLQAGTGISISANAAGIAGNPTITNTAPDQVVAFTGTNITIGGTYPNFTLTGNAGTVTSVGLSLPSIFSVSGSPVTGSGTLTGTLANQNANLVFAGPTTGAAATPTFRGLVAADIPNLDFSKITTGIVPIAQGGTNLSALGSALQYIRVNAVGTALEYATLSTTSGTVTSVNITQPAAGITATGGPITSSGSITLTLANDLAALEALSGTGIAARTGTDTWALRTITGSTYIGVSNGDGVSGAPTITNLGVTTVNGSTGAITGVLTTANVSGTAGRVPVFTGTNSIGDGTMRDDGAQVGVGAAAIAGFRLYVNAATRTDGTIVSRGSGSTTGSVNNASLRLWNTTVTTGDTWYLASENTGQFTLSSGLGAVLVGSILGDIQVSAKLRIGSVTGVTPTSIIGRDGSGDVGAIVVGSGLSLSGGTLTATGGGFTPSGATNQTLRFSATNTLSPTSLLTTGTAAVGVGVGTTLGATGLLQTSGLLNGVSLLVSGGTMASGNAGVRITGTGSTGVYGTDTDMTTTGGIVYGRIRNGATSGVSHAIMLLATASGSTGDPFIQFQNEGVGHWALGVDTSDSRKFKLASAATLGSLANNGLTAIAGDPMLFGINTDTPAYALDVNDKTRSKVYFNNAASLPTAVVGSGAGTGGTATVVAGGGNWIELNITIGASGAVSGGDLATITMPFSFPGLCYPVVSSQGDQASADFLKFKFIKTSASTWKAKMITGQTATAGATYNFIGHIFG